MLTIVFYTQNGKAAKFRSRELAAVKGDYVRVIDAGFWNGEKISCDRVDIMPDVPGWQRKRIVSAYGEDFNIFDVSEAMEVVQEEPARKPMGLMPQKEEEKKTADVAEKKAVHKGGGRWFVMAGEERISGPHDKSEAQRLAMEA